MTEARHLQVVRPTSRPVPADDDAERRAYWARLRALRAERDRLRAG
ncbi:MAG TPA: hypothetical protein VH915_06905 [Pedococcus sp.]|jgi:hypothetical protein